MTPRVIAESSVEPIDLDETAGNLRLFADGNSPPGWLEGARATKLIKAARQACEQELEMSLVAKTLEVAQDSFYQGVGWFDQALWQWRRPTAIELTQGPIRSIVSVTYVDSDGNDVVLAADQYRLNSYASPVVLIPAYNVTWPSARCDVGSVRVRYTVGYPSTDSPPEVVPEPIRQAMHLCIKHWFENRSAVEENTLAELPLGVKHLLSTYRRGLGV